MFPVHWTAAKLGVLSFCGESRMAQQPAGRALASCGCPHMEDHTGEGAANGKGDFG